MMKFELAKQIASTGRFPAIKLAIKSLSNNKVIQLEQFISYQFSSSIVIPVDSFSFTFCAPQDPKAFTDYCREGDLVCLSVRDDVDVCTGIIDQIETSVDEQGELVTIHGRDLMGQLEDNQAISESKKPLWGDNMTLDAVAGDLIKGTRIPGVQLLNTPSIKTLFATEPGESRLSALLRFIEPYNVVAWTGPDGKLIIGKPAFDAPVQQKLFIDKAARASNVLSMRATRSATSIPNEIVVLWSEVEKTQLGIQANQKFKNKAEGPTRLYQNGHKVIKTVMTSLPNGADPQSLASAAKFQTADSAGETVLQAAAKREFARVNFNELIVQCSVPGHHNDKGSAFLPNTMYTIFFDRASVDQNMYLFSVEWNLSPERGQYSVLSFCNPNTIVSDTRIPGARAR